MKKPIEQREEILLSLLSGEISKHQAARLLGCTARTIENYRNSYREHGKEGLVDHRHSNFHKLSVVDQKQIIRLKEKDRWRSARNIRDHLSLPVHERTVWKILNRNGLTHENSRRVKAIVRFEAEAPN